MAIGLLAVAGVLAGVTVGWLLRGFEVNKLKNENYLAIKESQEKDRYIQSMTEFLRNQLKINSELRKIIDERKKVEENGKH